jgi:hypothetical protein
MDLSNPTPRWVEVRFERSPRDAPGALDAVYGPTLPVWLQPAARPDWVVLAVPAEAVARHVLIDERVVGDRVSEFVWVFDRATGDVVSAGFSGVVLMRIGWGPFATDVEVELRTELSTERALGFLDARRLFGRDLHDVCGEGDGACRLVSPVRYQPESGYVNAVGVIHARTKGITTRTFSCLGEARFSERADPALPGTAVASSAP